MLVPEPMVHMVVTAEVDPSTDYGVHRMVRVYLEEGEEVPVLTKLLAPPSLDSGADCSADTKTRRAKPREDTGRTCTAALPDLPGRCGTTIWTKPGRFGPMPSSKGPGSGDGTADV